MNGLAGADTLESACRLAMRLLDAPVAALTTIEHHHQQVVVSTGAGATMLDVSLSQFVADSGRPLTVVDARAEAEPPGEAFPVVAFIGVPVDLGDDAPRGALSAFDSSPRAWSEEDEAALQALARLLAGHLRFQRALRERDELVGRLQAEVREDPLTGLHNRRQWLDVAPRELARAAREERALSVVILDFDHFRQVNTDYGPDTGDRLLRTVARLWSPLVRRPDLLVRWGGDEFVVLLGGADGAQARRVAQRLGFVVRDLVRVTAGIAEWDQAEDPAGLLARADEDLLRAKRARG